jgi:hypothetical protein
MNQATWRKTVPKMCLLAPPATARRIAPQLHSPPGPEASACSRGEHRHHLRHARLGRRRVAGQPQSWKSSIHRLLHRRHGPQQAGGQVEVRRAAAAHRAPAHARRSMCRRRWDGGAWPGV